MISDLTKKQINEFYELGYTVVSDVFTGTELAVISDAMDRLTEEAQSLNGMVMHKGSQFVVDQHRDRGAIRTQIKRIVWCGAAEPVLLKLGQDRRLTRMAGSILNCHQVNHLINQVHVKLPNDGVFFPFHQDSRHRGYGTKDWRDVNGKGSYVQMVMAIDEVTMVNGPMSFIPRSCKSGHLDLPYDEDVQTVSEHFDPADAVPVLMQPGTVALFGPYTIHGSLPNNSTSPRRVFINGFAYPGANSRQYSGDGSGILIDIPE
jgi:ectoine hydroxylase-related dioxygenase (phytanoyl-CoA dioxygenase family)